MKLCCVNINSAETSDSFLPVLGRSIDLARRDETEVAIVSVEPGLQRALDVNSNYFSLLNKASIVDKVVAASAEGYDAAVVVCFLDPAISEAREMVDIPVVGLAEASMFLACQLGRKFAIVTLDEPKMILEIERNLKLSGLEDRAIRNPIVPIDIPSRDWLKRGMHERAWVTDAIRQKAERCVAAGAEVIIVGCAGLAPIATLGGLSKIEGVDVPVIDCVQAGIKMAEFRVELARKLNWPVVSRAGAYAKPSERDVQRVRNSFGRAAI